MKSISSRNFGLDIVRAVAILLVVSVHGSYLITGTFLDGFPYIRMIDGVDLFFVLSGFLIGGILLKEINTGEAFGLRKLSNFWRRRWFRTLPNYYLILLLNYVFVHFHVINGDTKDAGWHFLFFLQNLYAPFTGFFWESWSLSVEEWFYLSSPILLVIFLNFFTPKRSFLLVTLLMMVLPALHRTLIMDRSINPFWYEQLYRKVVICRLDSIAYGLLSAWVFYYYRDSWRKYRYWCFALGSVLIAFLLNYRAPASVFYNQVLLFTLTPLSAMLLLPLAQSYKTETGLLARFVTHISIISYSMYLINLSIVAEVFRRHFPPQGEWDGVMKYVLYWIIVIGGSTLLYYGYEKPMMNLRDRKKGEGKKNDTMSQLRPKV